MSYQDNKIVEIQNPTVAVLAIDSSDAEQYDSITGIRFSSNNPSRIYINNNENLIFGYCKSLALTEIAIQYDTPNVNSYNNTLTIGAFNNAGLLLTVQRLTIPIAFYTGPALGANIANALNANTSLTSLFGANTFSVIFGGLICGTDPLAAGQTLTSLSPKYEIITSSILGRFAILPCTKQVPGFTSIPTLQGDLTDMMGITPTASGLTTYRTLQGGYASLQYTPYIDVVSTLLTKNQNVADATSRKAGKQSILARVFLNDEDFQKRQFTVTYSESVGAFISSTDNAIGTSNGVLRREFVYPKQIQWNKTENIDVIDIQLLDSKQRPLFYQPSAVVIDANTVRIENTADVFITIQVTEV